MTTNSAKCIQTKAGFESCQKVWSKSARCAGKKPLQQWTMWYLLLPNKTRMGYGCDAWYFYSPTTNSNHINKKALSKINVRVFSDSHTNLKIDICNLYAFSQCERSTELFDLPHRRSNVYYLSFFWRICRTYEIYSYTRIPSHFSISMHGLLLTPYNITKFSHNSYKILSTSWQWVSFSFLLLLIFLQIIQLYSCQYILHPWCSSWWVL